MIARLASFAAVVALAVGILAGCANTPADISSSIAAQMQTTVVSIADSAAAGDSASALAQLDQLQGQLDAALADGSVSAERASAIQSRIDLVREDLQPEPVVEPAPAPPADSGNDDNDDDDDDSGKDNSGPGNNNGNGNGNGKGDD